MNHELRIKDKKYPKILKEITDPPERLFYRGNLDALNYKYAVAVVGTRRCSEYGREAARKITKELAQSGLTIVSGLARGIDSTAHITALEYGAPTIAVLGSPITDKEIYPQQNLNLAHKIINAGGLILSEYDTGTPSYPANFPERNRVVAGLSCGVVVIEAPIDSGARITARLALDYNRDVYVVPGSIFSRLNEGSHEIIKTGAKLITSAHDILEDIPAKFFPNKNGGKGNNADILLNEQEKKVVALIRESANPIHIDKITQMTRLSAPEVAQITTSLVLQDLIRESLPNTYIASQ